ncbi:hypothetical protein WISP_75900 [Willisornis vidua]|uniref:Uncharacterized protein n=1 Tax=Willisornis vidua TaxID=1566151 RepID=A0ABQ9D659_9PASS|nr:hypothetical protein WISP_75900 [Willisornis vidua]
MSLKGRHKRWTRKDSWNSSQIEGTEQRQGHRICKYLEAPQVSYRHTIPMLLHLPHADLIILKRHKWEQTILERIIKISSSFKEETGLPADFLIRKSKRSKPSGNPQVLPVHAKHLDTYGIKMNKLEAFITEKFATVDKVTHQSKAARTALANSI